MGTHNEYQQAIAAVKKWGINVIADIVLNHKAGADATERVQVERVDPENRNATISSPFYIDAYTLFPFPGRAGKYSSFTWDHTCFSAIDYNNRTKENGVFRIVNSFSRDWQHVVGTEKGNFDYLMFADIEFRNQKVVRELTTFSRAAYHFPPSHIRWRFFLCCCHLRIAQTIPSENCFGG